MSEIVNSIRKIVKQMAAPELLLGEVKSYSSSANTIEVAFNNGTTTDQATIRSVINNEATGIFIEPVIGSVVLCAKTDGRIEDMKVLLYSEIKNIKIMPSDNLTLRGDALGGLVKSQVVNAQINEIKTEINNLKKIFNTWTLTGSELSVGAVALKTALAAWAASLSLTTQTDYENSNVKHG